ncbi:hypothetical protein MIND_01359600 [Mycena indigotica]|uniref:Uncharacterized protein n=1 Tax=Mycena indigotica TaxID=2126181 RepID=A0A8H6RZS8_9AGAR|nr:uncharacterized protein MIND_01359600 [Mycena indigotica]KAF7289852.1 hypothetical protein MIND_01359600 [Mycena indigotica]
MQDWTSEVPTPQPILSSVRSLTLGLRWEATQTWSDSDDWEPRQVQLEPPLRILLGNILSHLDLPNLSYLCLHAAKPERYRRKQFIPWPQNAFLRFIARSMTIRLSSLLLYGDITGNPTLSPTGGLIYPNKHVLFKDDLLRALCCAKDATILVPGLKDLAVASDLEDITDDVCLEFLASRVQQLQKRQPDAVFSLQITIMSLGGSGFQMGESSVALKAKENKFGALVESLIVGGKLRLSFLSISELEAVLEDPYLKANLPTARTRSDRTSIWGRSYDDVLDEDSEGGRRRLGLRIKA